MSAIRSQSKVSRDSNRRRQVKVGFLDTDKVQRMEQNKVEKFSVSGKMQGCKLKIELEIKEPDLFA